MRVSAQGKYAPLALECDSPLAVLGWGRRRIRSPPFDPKFAREEDRARGLLATEIQNPHTREQRRFSPQAFDLTQRVLTARVVMRPPWVVFCRELTAARRPA